jgi:hypothetical protein
MPVRQDQGLNFAAQDMCDPWIAAVRLRGAPIIREYCFFVPYRAIILVQNAVMAGLLSSAISSSPSRSSGSEMSTSDVTIENSSSDLNDA